MWSALRPLMTKVIFTAAEHDLGYLQPPSLTDENHSEEKTNEENRTAVCAAAFFTWV